MSSLNAHIDVFPTDKGYNFISIRSLQRAPHTHEDALKQLAQKIKDCNPTILAGLDTRGTVLTSCLAMILKLPYVALVKKGGKLPPRDILTSPEQSSVYGTSQFQMNRNDFKADDRVVIIDDIAESYGTMIAAVDLIHTSLASIVGLACLIEVEHEKQLKAFRYLEGIPRLKLLTYLEDGTLKTHIRTVGVASKNEDKLAAARISLLHVTGFTAHPTIQIVSDTSESGVGEQPYGMEQIQKGCENRCLDVYRKTKRPLIIGFENGIIIGEKQSSDICCVYIFYRGRYAKHEFSDPVFFPTELVKMIQEGETIGDVMNRMYGYNKSNWHEHYDSRGRNRIQLMSDVCIKVLKDVIKEWDPFVF